MNKKVSAILFAVLAVVLYAINIPFSKLLLENIVVIDTLTKNHSHTHNIKI